MYSDHANYAYLIAFEADMINEKKMYKFMLQINNIIKFIHRIVFFSYIIAIAHVFIKQ